jgi:hypothetical protein
LFVFFFIPPGLLVSRRPGPLWGFLFSLGGLIYPAMPLPQ